MRKSATGPRSPSKIDELLADVGQLEAFIIAAEERLELVADELCRRQRLSVVLDPRVEIGTWEWTGQLFVDSSVAIIDGNDRGVYEQQSAIHG